MAQFDFSSISITQIAMLVSIIIISILGFANQRRMIKRKQEDEEAIYNMSNQDEIKKSGFTEEEKLPLKNYILEYKSQYSYDSIKSALINNGYRSELVEACLKEYF